MAFKMKPSTYLKTKPNTRSMGMFKQTSLDPPTGEKMLGTASDDVSTTSVGYRDVDSSGQLVPVSFDERGVGVQAGPEWYTSGGVENVSYDILSPQQKEALEVFRNSPDHNIEGNVYSKDGKLYFDQGTYMTEESRMVEPLLIDTQFNTSDSNNVAPENEGEVEEEEGANFTDSIGGFTVGGSKNQHTFSTKNPYLPTDGSKKFKDQRRIQLARKWERQNNTDKKRSATNRFGDTFEK